MKKTEIQHDMLASFQFYQDNRLFAAYSKTGYGITSSLSLLTHFFILELCFDNTCFILSIIKYDLLWISRKMLKLVRKNK